MKGAAQGLSYREIAQQIGRCHKTVGAEIKRNGGRQQYSAARAQARAVQMASNPRRPSLIESSPATEGFARLGFALGWSPQQISGRIRATNPAGVLPVSTRTLYRWTARLGQKSKSGFGRKKPGRAVYFLRPRRKYRARNPATGRLSDTVSIHQRPAEVATRETAGHWEADTMLGPRGTKACLLTLVERKTRLLIALPVADRRAQTVARALLRHLPIKAQAAGVPILSITTDNGKEFAEHAPIAQALGCAFYFADPNSPHQRGTNENTNGLLREFFPKNRNLTLVTSKDLAWVVGQINNRPRMCLNYLSPAEAAANALRITNGDIGVAQ
jgi:IS30 family transposase